MAFAPPPRPGLPHPSPWAALGEGGLTVLTELELTADAESIGFDRLNTVWFVVALLRLRLGQPLQVPVIADRPFSLVKSAPESANIIPVELGAPLARTSPHRGATQSDLQWIQSHLRGAAALMQDPIFNRALHTFDRAVAVPNSGAGIVIAWASIESLLRPGQQRITERVCRALATLLHPPGNTRDRAFTEILACYEARGGVAHAGHMPDTKQFTKAFDLARAALMATIEQGRLPSTDELLQRWSQKL